MVILPYDGGRIEKTLIVLRIVLEYDRLHLFHLDPNGYQGTSLELQAWEREKMTDITIGADISKDHIDLYRLPDGRRLRISNDRQGFCALVKWLGEELVSRIVYEPTGAYHKKFERFMLFHGLPLSKVNPRFAHSFAIMKGKLAKTDAIDAQMLAHYGLMAQPRHLESDVLEMAELKELHTARLRLVKDRVALKNRGKNLTLSCLKKQNARALKQIEADMATIDENIMARIKADETLKARFEIILSIPGISTITAFTLLIEMPELGNIDHKAAAALSGPAPISRQSGKWKGRSFIQAGRSVVRKALYMPALVAMRFNPDLAKKYQDLIQAGKMPKVAITAVMRKLIILANALLKNQQKWTQKTA